MNNPLERNPHPYGTDEFCGWMNVRLWQRRRDIEWAPDGNGGILLRDRQEWVDQHSEDMKRKAEQERADWKHRQRYPVTATKEEAR